MSEKFIDLNTLRESARAEADGETKSKEERIRELQIKILETEDAPVNLSRLEAFQALEVEARQDEVERLIRQGDRPNTYTVEDRMEELEKSTRTTPSARNIRLNLWREELQKLLNE